MKPNIIAITAVTIDGRIARNRSHFTDWTSPEDKSFLHGFLNTCDAVVVGNNTYKTAEEPLSKRNCIVFTREVKTSKQMRENLLMLNPSGALIETAFGKYQTIALLGGTQTYSYFLERDMIDEIYLTIEPIIFGEGLPLFDCEREAINFSIVSFEKLNDRGTMLLHYQRN